MSSSTHSQEKHPLSSGMDHALDGEAQGPVKQLRRPGDMGPAMQSAANASPRVKQLRASEAAANTAVMQRKKSNGTGLPDDLKAGIESLSGMSMDHVRVVYNSSKPAEVQALAYAEGSVIHVAPGQEAHLPEEAWHVVQQMQGKVKATTEVNHSPVNDDRRLEDEAREMGAKALSLHAPAQETPLQSAPVTGSPVKQLKSEIKTMDYSSELTPLATLTQAVGPYFAKAKLPEAYIFHGNKLPPIAYKASFKRAKSATAELKTGSKASPRDNTVIRPYGHFGMMERAIMGRPDYNNIYDGGHLIERSLLDGANGDQEGNLAPQEGKTFNQNLMRGWERVVEKYHKLTTFTYRLDLGYTEDTYTRSGKDLLDAGVVPAQLHAQLNPTDQQNLEKATITFVRWVPAKWTGSLDAGEGKKFSKQAMNYGKHHHRLMDSTEDAESTVVEKVKQTGLKRTKSGFFHGAISTFSLSGKKFTVGDSRTIKSEMFAGVPEIGQPKGERGDLKPSKLNSTQLSMALLKEPFSFKQLQDDLEGYYPKTMRKSRIINKTNKTIDTACKKLSNAYQRLRNQGYFTEKSGAAFVVCLYNATLKDPSFALTKTNFLELARIGFEDEKSKRWLLTMDEKCYDGDIPKETEEKEDLEDLEDLEEEEEIASVVKDDLSDLNLNNQPSLQAHTKIVDELGILSDLDEEDKEKDDDDKTVENHDEDLSDDHFSIEEEEVDQEEALTRKRDEETCTENLSFLDYLLSLESKLEEPNAKRRKKHVEDKIVEEDLDEDKIEEEDLETQSLQTSSFGLDFDPSKLNFSFNQQN
jgi:hypothetical protein